MLRPSLACLLAQRHLPIEDVPGVGKTTLALGRRTRDPGRFRRERQLISKTIPVPFRPSPFRHPHSFPHLALHHAAGLSYLGSFRNLHCNRKTAAERATRQSLHQPASAGISGNSFNERFGCTCPVGQPSGSGACGIRALPLPPSPFLPSFGASSGGLGSFRNLHCGQETGGVPRHEVSFAEQSTRRKSRHIGESTNDPNSAHHACSDIMTMDAGFPV